MKRFLGLLAAALMVSTTAVTMAQAPRRGHIGGGEYVAPDDPMLIAKAVEQVTREQEAKSLREQAKAAIRKGDSNSAFSLLQQALGDDPTDGETCVLLAYHYIQKNEPDGVIATLGPIIYPVDHGTNSIGDQFPTRMLYILALLDHNSWRQAVACYDKTMHSVTSQALASQVPSQKWYLPGGGPSHDWPDSHFYADSPDYAGMRAQAHLILGSSTPSFMEEKAKFPYMLEHLRLVLQIHPDSLDATFLSGWTLRKMDRFAEARAAFASAAKLGSPAVRKEINEELVTLNSREETKKAEDAQKAAKQAKLK